MSKQGLPTQYRLKFWLEYSQQTGIFRWKESPARNVKAGSVAGSKTANGGWQIGLDGCVYSAGVLAWIYVHGSEPKGWISYIDKDSGNNRINNLEDVHLNEVRHKHKKPSNNTSGVKGVFYDRAKNRYRTQVRLNGKKYGTGLHKSKEDAERAVIELRRKLHGERATDA